MPTQPILPPEIQDLKTVLWTIGITLTGLTIIANGLIQFFIDRGRRVAEDKRALRELAMKAAIVEWEHYLSLPDTEGTFPNERPKRRDCFDYMLVRKLKLLELFSDVGDSPEAFYEKARVMTEIGKVIRFPDPPTENQ